MKQFQYVITDPIGIHARPAGLLVKAAKALDSTVTVEKVGGKSTVATKLMAVMGLGVKGGDTVTVMVEGGNEEASLQVMEQFFKENL
ncbi:MAG: HPr family phosphocarrier protein [Candidatus Faecousia sp.]|nr:HPr family phosphocarrier protein [Clostridiales bacterium]MCI6937472.1 HPr family phosphocarrier protein [Clostridiales bacterium]MDY4598334.1 HPr family phosphocarrier protein [Candidatus Faecousia sp.]